MCIKGEKIMKKYKEKLKEWIKVITSLIFLAIFMFLIYGFMLIGCAMDEYGCYRMHMQSIVEVPYEPR